MPSIATAFKYHQRSQIVEDTVEPSFLSENLISRMHVSNIGLDYSAGPGIEPRTVYVQPPKANTHRAKPPDQPQGTV